MTIPNSNPTNKQHPNVTVAGTKSTSINSTNTLINYTINVNF